MTDPIYVITTFDKNFGERKTAGGSRTWMWLPDEDSAVQCVLKNDCDLFEGSTNAWAVIERIKPGFCVADEVAWFSAREGEHGTVVSRCEKPDWAGGICNWGMG